MVGCNKPTVNYRTIAFEKYGGESGAPIYVLGGRNIARVVDGEIVLMEPGNSRNQLLLPYGSRADWHFNLRVSGCGTLIPFRIVNNTTVSSYNQVVQLCEINVMTGKTNALCNLSLSARDVCYSPDNKRLAVLLKNPETGYTIYSVSRGMHIETKKWTLPSDQVVKLCGWDTKGCSVYLSVHDGKSVSLKILDVDTGSRSVVAKNLAGVKWPDCVTVDSSHKKLAYSVDGKVMLSDIDGTNAKMITKTLGTTYKTAFSNSGRFLAVAYASKDELSSIVLIDIKSGNTRTINYYMKKSSPYPCIQLLDWHPKKDKVLARVMKSDNFELREYDVGSMLK